MHHNAVRALASLLLLSPLLAHAALNTMPSALPAVGLQAQEVRAPAPCELACSLSQAGNCQAGDVTGNRGGDVQCAASRIGQFVTGTMLSTFGTGGGCVDKADNNKCASGSCTSYNGQPTLGVAHRTFPFGTRVNVCNPATGICKIATVVERGPHSRVGNVTLDARAELGLELGMGCNNKVKATYQVLSVPGVAQTADPTGPTDEGLDKLLAMNAIRGDLGNNESNPTNYKMVDTPYGPGFMGTPKTQPGGSPYASASPAPIASGSSGGYGASPVPVSQQLGASPYSAVTGTNAGTDLQNALNPATAQAPSQRIIPGAPQVGSIALQPAVVSRAGTVVIAWTSLNMKAGSCSVMLGSQVLATGPEGSKTIPAANLGGTVQISLRCTKQDGTPFVVSDMVTAQ